MCRPRLALPTSPFRSTRRTTPAVRGLVATGVLLAVATGCSGGATDDGTAPAPEAKRVSTAHATAPTSGATPLPALPRRSDANLVVLGDAASNDTSEWVNVMGRLLSREQHVRVQRVNPDDPTRYLDPVDYSDGEEVLDIWNASVDEPQPLDAQAAADVIPETTRTVLISRGRNADASAIAGELDTTLASIRKVRPRAAVAVVLEPDDGDSSEALQRVATWAGDKGLPVIDVAGAFARTNEQATLLDDQGRPTDAGRDLWAEVVAAEVADR